MKMPEIAIDEMNFLGNTDEDCKTLAFELLFAYIGVGAVVYAFLTLMVKSVRRRLKAARPQEEATSFPLSNLLELCGEQDPESFDKVL